MRGVGRDLNSLVSFAVTPRTAPDDQGRYLRLLRPLTRILVVTDAEGPMTTQHQRAERRQVWVDRILWELPPHHRTRSVRESLERLVYVDTWRRSGLSFEFAHFSDRQLAEAMTRLDRRPRRPTLAARVQHLLAVRERRGNIDRLMDGISKPDLADELWPVLAQKIHRAVRNKTERRVPIVRVLDRATDLAREVPRRNVVIPLNRAR
jgi:hypothetical protein